MLQQVIQEPIIISKCQSCLFGFWSGKMRCPRPVRWAFASANPVSVGFGFWMYQVFLSSVGPGEYFGYASLMFLALLGPLLLAPVVLLGVRAYAQLRSGGLNSLST